MVRVYRTELNRSERMDQVRIGPITDVFTGKPFGEAVPVMVQTPAWKAGPEGMPTDRDVWAYLAVYDGEDEVELVRGRAEGRRFGLAGSDGWDDRDVANIICWIEVEDQPAFSLAVAKATVAALERLERLGNGHMVEDWLHREALRAVVAGHPDAQAIAEAALESRQVKFTRYYS